MATKPTTNKLEKSAKVVTHNLWQPKDRRKVRGNIGYFENAPDKKKVSIQIVQPVNVGEWITLSVFKKDQKAPEED